MPLNKQKVALPISKGINQKVDPKQDQPGTLEVLENVQVDKFGEIEKREGYEKIQDRYGYVSTTTTRPLSNVQAISSLKDDLVIFSDHKAFSNRVNLGKAVLEGRYSPAKLTTTQLQGNDQYLHNNVNSVVKDNFLYSVYDLRIGGNVYPRIAVKNLDTDTFFVPEYSLAGGTVSFSRPKIISLGNRIIKFAVYIDGGGLFHVVYNSANPTSYSDLIDDTWTTLYEIHADKVYDVVANESGTVAMLVYKKVTTGYFATVPLFLDPTSSTGALEVGYTTSSTAAVSALDVSPILSNPKKDGVRTTALDEGGFFISAVFASTIGAMSFDKEGTTVVLNTTFDNGTTWASVVPHAITGIARDNNYGSYSGAIAYELFVQMQLTATATGTSTNKLYMRDNTTGTYASDDILASDFSGGSNYIKTEGSSTAWTGITYANFPAWNNKRIGRIRFEVTSTGIVGSTNSDQYFVIGGTLTHKPYLVDGDTVVPIGRATTLQNSYYLMTPPDYDLTLDLPLGLISYGISESQYVYNSDWASGYPSVPSISKYGDDIILPILKKGKIKSNDNTFFTTSIPAYTQISYSSNIANQTEEMAGNLLAAGSLLFNSDQLRFIEHGFLYNPDTLYVHTQNMTSTAAIFSTSEAYKYVACYRFEDESGNIHRSGVSKQLVATLSANYDNIDVIVPMLNITGKYAYQTFIELYRTTNGGTIFYKVSDTAISATVSASYNAITYNYIKLRDTTVDSSLTDNELLYTTGGVLENTPIGSCAILESFKNRVFMGGVENRPSLLYFSKITTGQNVPVEFNDTLTVEVPKPGGDIVAIKAMDDKLIILKKNALYFLTGEGPNNLGQQNDFIEPHLISSDVGCKFANSVVLMPKGLMFMSQKGIYLLNRSLGLSYIGAPADNYNDLNITKATTVAKKDEVRFLTSDGDTIIYNYFLDMWYSYSDHRGNSSHVIGDDYYLATYKDEIFKQVNTTSSFGGSMVPIKLETGWLSFAGVQGFQRVYRMLLLGEYKSPHKIQIKVAYNYDNVWTDEKLIDVTGYTESYSFGNPSVDDVAPPTYGTPDGLAGAPAAITYGGKDNTQYQIRFNFRKQKCEAIKIQILEVEGSNPNYNAESAGPGFNLSNLSFVVGIKGGDFRIKQARTFGSTSIT